MNRTFAGLIVTVGAGLALVGCSGDTSDSAALSSAVSPTAVSSTAGSPMGMPSMSMEMPSATASSASGEIVISNFRFAVPATVSPGEQIIIRNEDTEEHSVTADSGDAFDVDVDGGESVTMIVPSSTGAYAFHCEYHPNMVGSLTVS